MAFKDASGTSAPRKVYETIKRTREILGADAHIRFHSHDGTLGVSKYDTFMTGNESLAPISGASATCYDGSESTNGTCGSGNTSGNPGAVVISW